jgi:hypothetical protein
LPAADSPDEIELASVPPIFYHHPPKPRPRH